MSHPLRKIEYENFNELRRELRPVHKLKKRTKKRKNVFALFFCTILLCLYSYYICPYNYENYLRPLFVNRILNKNLNLNADKYVFPTIGYLNNSFLLNSYLRADSNISSKEIADIKIVNEMTSTKEKLLEIFSNYQNLSPAVFVWEYSTGSGFEINSDTLSFCKYNQNTYCL